jgi:GH15 family glucan-1,4-alpha-glucosidase
LPNRTTAPHDASTEPASRETGYVDLRSYGAVGDGRTVALIAEDGSVDWLPIPSLDSIPVFARLLDAEGGGAIALAPVEAFTVTRRYVEDTNVLETTFTTGSGVARVTDALVTGVAGRLPWVELARRIDGVSGAVKFRWKVAPGSRLGTASPWIDTTTHGPVIRIDGVTIAVRGIDHGARRSGNQAIVGTFTTEAGSLHQVTVVGTEKEPLHLPDPQNVDRGIDRTIDNWRAWSKEFNYGGPWSDAVQRSALALKLLIFSPTGAIAAAATTSLPESLAGGKNWDYRYAWVRDLAYTVTALTRFGLREETHGSVSWLLRTIRDNGPDLHVFYTLEGGVPEGVDEHELVGWRGIKPVVTGNPARGQLQLGVYGDLFDVMRRYVEAGNVLDAETGRLLASVADKTCDAWHQPDHGMWELPDVHHYTSSKMGCWSALDNAVRLCELGQIPGSGERWAAERDAIKEWVEENCWSEEKQSYVFFVGTDDLDASVLLHAPSGFERGPRMASTIDAVRAELGAGSLLYRYSGVQSEEATFVSCAFWAASALACVGRHDDAIALMDELVDLANDVGLYSEMIDPDSLAFLGNFPQGLSHLALVNTAITIEELTR